MRYIVTNHWDAGPIPIIPMATRAAFKFAVSGREADKLVVTL